MFFIAGASSKREELDFNQNIICNNCGQYGRYKVFMTFDVVLNMQSHLNKKKRCNGKKIPLHLFLVCPAWAQTSR